MKILITVLLISICTAAQELRPAFTFPLEILAPDPDAPSTVQPPITVEPTCGPAWLGGCWKFPNRPLRDVVTDCRFWCSTLALTGATAFDYAITRIGLDKGKCIEANPNIGQDPTALTFLKDFVETHLPVIVGGMFVSKVLPKKGWASWIYPAWAAYGVQLHLRGGASWLGECW